MISVAQETKRSPGPITSTVLHHQVLPWAPARSGPRFPGATCAAFNRLTLLMVKLFVEGQYVGNHLPEILPSVALSEYAGGWTP